MTPTTTPRVAAPLYQLEVSDDSNFSHIVLLDRTDADTYTPVSGKGLAVAPLIGVSLWWMPRTKFGAYSLVQQFKKEYQPPVLIYPLQGESFADRHELYLGADARRRLLSV